MKTKYLLMSTLMLVSTLFANAQDDYYFSSKKKEPSSSSVSDKGSDHIFFADEFNNDVDKFNAISGGNKSRAREIAKLGHMNKDKAINWQYVIPCKDSIDVEMFMKTVKDWHRHVFRSDRELTQSSTGEQFESDNAVTGASSNSMEFEAYSRNVSYLTTSSMLGTVHPISISVKIRFKVDVKDTRYRITCGVQHYEMLKSSLSSGVERLIYSVGDVYPFVDSKNKESFSMAYINSNCRVINLMSDFINYMNSNYQKKAEMIQEEENW